MDEYWYFEVHVDILSLNVTLLVNIVMKISNKNVTVCLDIRIHIVLNKMS